jgi:hypothetical protein
MTLTPCPTRTNRAEMCVDALYLLLPNASRQGVTPWVLKGNQTCYSPTNRIPPFRLWNDGVTVHRRCSNVQLLEKLGPIDSNRRLNGETASFLHPPSDTLAADPAPQQWGGDLSPLPWSDVSVYAAHKISQSVSLSSSFIYRLHTKSVSQSVYLVVSYIGGPPVPYNYETSEMAPTWYCCSLSTCVPLTLCRPLASMS